MIIFLSLIIANFICKLKNINLLDLKEKNYTVLILRDTILGDNSNTTLGKFLDSNLKNNLVVIKSDVFDNFKIGDIIEVNGKVKKNNSQTNVFDMLFLGKINYQFSFPEIRLIGKQSGFYFVKFISYIRDKIDNNIKEIVGIKNYSLISMWLLGKTKIDDSKLNDLFRNLGISHILVISGTHLTILFNVLGYILILFVSNYWLSNFILLIFLLIFLFLTGVSSSILRATLFWIILMLSKINGRIINYTNTLLLVLLMFFIINPLVIIYDIGFHLSFLSIVSLIYVLPIINSWISVKNHYFEWMVAIFNTTLAVTIVLLPYLVFQFSEFTVFSVIFNVILIPFSGLILSIVFIAIILSFGWMFFSHILGWIVFMMVNMFLWILNVLNLMSIKINIFLFNSIFFVTVYYILLIIWVINFYIKNKKLTFNL